MDEFGVLVESIGFKAHGRSAPMAELKNKPKSNFTADSSIGDASSVDSFCLPIEELDGIFRSNYDANKTRESQNSFGGDDIFGGPVPSSNQYGGIDLESMLNSSIQNKGSGNSNLTNSIGPIADDDLLGLESEHGDPVGGSFDGFEVHSSGKQETKGSGFEDLIPGFGGASPSNQGAISKTDLPQESKGHSSKTRSTLEDDPFLVFETRVSQSDATWSYVGPSEEEISKGSVQSALDELDDFAMGDGHNGAETDVKRATSNKASRGTASNESENVDNLDEFFSGGVQQNDAARSTSTKDSQFDIFFHEEKGPEGKQTSSWSSCSTKKVSSTTNMGDDYSALFGGVTTSSGEFHEIEGEPEERRKSRLNRHIRTNARIAEALAEKNQRDLQNQQEQEEKRRLAETVDSDIRRWAAGKEGNMRALLSSLHQVLWPECGWRPVTLTDIITSDSVKKVYKKATLCVHPDKVQQKGANLQQKYVAEKVFDLLKEAWKKFGAEELR